MYSIIQTYRSGRKSVQAPIDEYQWKHGFFGRDGIKRVETTWFIRFEHLSFGQKTDYYRYSRRSHWFINFPFCKNDKQVLITNILFALIFFQVLGSIMVHLLPPLIQALQSKL